MGYRLSVDMVGENSPRYYGTKLYGYKDETKLKSYQWLIKEGFLDANENYVWGYNCDNPILMRAEDFKIFAKLYNEDLNIFLIPEMKDYFIKDEDIQQFLQLEDWKLVVISWY